MQEPIRDTTSVLFDPTTTQIVWVVTYLTSSDNPHMVYTPVCGVFSKCEDAISFVHVQVKKLQEVGKCRIVEDKLAEDGDPIHILLEHTGEPSAYYVTKSPIDA